LTGIVVRLSALIEMGTLEQRVARAVGEDVAIVPYDSRWPEFFRREAEHLCACVPGGLIRRIEHFGSTAVPGLAAKPVIDLLVEVSSLKAAREEIAPILKAQGYDYFWRPSFGNDVPPWYAFFIRRDQHGTRTHHIHMVTGRHTFREHWDRLLFRDYLIGHPKVAEEYARLKADLAAMHPNDRVSYTSGKSAFIQRVTTKAKKSMKSSNFAVGLLLALVLPFTVNAQTGQAPSVTADPASQVSGTSALITGTINPNGLPTVWHVAYGTNTAYYTNLFDVLPAQAAPISISTNLYGLNPRTAYHYQLIATNSAGQASSPDMSFTTGGSNVPSVWLFGPAQITTSDIAVTGGIIPNGLVTGFALFWGTNTAYDHHDGWGSLPAQNTWVPVGGSMLGLSPGTTYHCQLVASNHDGYGYSADMTLTTLTPPPPPQPPAVVTALAFSISDINAYLTGSVTPNAADANFTFRWGTTTAYGNSTVFPGSPLTDWPQDVGALITGLSPATSYHYQLTATNSAGIGLGQDQTFTTLSAASVYDQVPTLSFRVLHAFTDSEGPSPSARLTLSGNTLYGTTELTLFKVDTDGKGFTTLHAYNIPGGPAGPTGLVLSGSTLYGTTAGGFGYVNYGTVFAVQTDGTGYTNLHNFSWGDGAYPESGLVLSGNTLYGTTFEGGPWTNGTLFAINTDATGFTNLHFFFYTHPPTNGHSPQGGVILSGNTLYGTAQSGGDWDGGVIYAINTNGTGYTNIHSFKYYPGNGPTNEDGSSPECDLILSGNTLYGTAYWGGTFGAGSVFKVNVDGTGVTNLHSFQWTDYPASPPMQPIPNADGGYPSAGLLLVGDTLFGTTSRGGRYANGTVFALKTDGTGFTVLHSFTGGSDGGNPVAGLVASGNALYAVATKGGSFGNGTLFAISFGPQLTIDAHETNVIVTWPTNYLGFDYSGFVLQSSTNLASGIWTTNLFAPGVLNGQKVVTNPILGTQQFFRLSQ
jgi:uncharacterized repeat protein (TIGR03803 family)